MSASLVFALPSLLFYFCFSRVLLNFCCCCCKLGHYFESQENSKGLSDSDSGNWYTDRDEYDNDIYDGDDDDGDSDSPAALAAGTVVKVKTVLMTATLVRALLH